MDQLATKIHAAGLEALAVDNEEDVFDVYAQYAGTPPSFIDKFKAPSRTARRFATLKKTYTPRYMIADSNDDIVTDSPLEGSVNDNIAVFIRESKVPKLFAPISGSAWGGFAFDKGQKHLYAISTSLSDGTQLIHIFGFDPKTGTVGKEERLFGNIRPIGTAIAIFAGSP